MVWLNSPTHHEYDLIGIRPDIYLFWHPQIHNCIDASQELSVGVSNKTAILYRCGIRAIAAGNALSISPWSLSNKNWEVSTGCPSLSMLNYGKNQCRSNKTVILNATTGAIYTYKNITYQTIYVICHDMFGLFRQNFDCNGPATENKNGPYQLG